MEKRILVIDINYLTSEYKEMELSEMKKKLQKEYGYKVFITDGSKQNLSGAGLGQTPPIYFLY